MQATQSADCPLDVRRNGCASVVLIWVFMLCPEKRSLAPGKKLSSMLATQSADCPLDVRRNECASVVLNSGLALSPFPLPLAYLRIEKRVKRFQRMQTTQVR